MALPVQKTLGELRTRLARRIGYVDNPDDADPELLNDILEEAQIEIYEHLTAWWGGVTDFELTTVAGQSSYEWPAMLDVGRIEFMLVDISGLDGTRDFHEVTEGWHIVHDYDQRTAEQSWPLRYRRSATLDLAPTPEAAYPIIIRAQMRLGEFTEDSHRATVPWDLLFARAVAMAFEQQGDPPPQVVVLQFTKRMGQLRARSHDKANYVPRRHGSIEYSRPIAAPGAVER